MSDSGVGRLPRPAYYLGHSDRELDRLKAQARLVDPITRRFFRDAGIVPGMRVLDVGSGVGDVAFVVADLVGDSGEVVGVDRAPNALAKAKARADGQSRRNVFFREGVRPAVRRCRRTLRIAVSARSRGDAPKAGSSREARRLDRVPRSRLERRPLISAIADLRAVLPMDPRDASVAECRVANGYQTPCDVPCRRIAGADDEIGSGRRRSFKRLGSSASVGEPSRDDGPGNGAPGCRDSRRDCIGDAGQANGR